MNNVVFLHNLCMKMLFLLSFCCSMLLCSCPTQPLLYGLGPYLSIVSYSMGLAFTKQSLLFLYLHNVGHNAFDVFAQDTDAALV